MGFVLDGLETEAYDRSYSDRDLLVRIVRYFRAYRRQMALVGVAIALNSAAGTGGPILISRAIDRVGQDAATTTLLLLVGMAALFFLVRPYLAYLSWSPAQLAATWLSNLVYIGLTARAMSLIGNTLLDVFVSFVPSYVWAASFALFGGIGSLWVLSFRKLGRFSLPGEPVKTAAYRLKE